MGGSAPGEEEATYPHTWGSTAVAPSLAVRSGAVGIAGGNSSRGRSERDAGAGLSPKNHCLPEPPPQLQNPTLS